jgi:RNA-directed DNA polymerase
LTARSNGRGNEYRTLKLTQFIRGWVNYSALADMKRLLSDTDEWLRRKIRAIYWKQWKKVKTRYKMIKKYNLSEWKVHDMANCRKGIWRSSIMLNSVLTNKEIACLGYITMTDYYLKVCENQGTPYTERYVRWCGRSVAVIISYLLPDYLVLFSINLKEY